MNDTTGMPGVDPQMTNAMSVYGQDGALDDFPVLKAFQQYVDAEQAKAQKRMTALCIFFITLMVGIVAVFVLLLINISARNQSLNDRMIELALNREHAAPASSPVVVQPPQDSAAILALTAKMDAMQKKLAEDQAKAEQAAKEAAEKARKAAIEAATPKGPTPEELEIKRLKALLAAEKEKSSLEKERQRQAELEAYRRKHYPEYYAPEKPRRATVKEPVRDEIEEEIDEEDDLDDIVNFAKKVSEDDDEETPSQAEPVKSQAKPVKTETKPTEPEPEKEYSIPVDVKGSSINRNIPDED